MLGTMNSMVLAAATCPTGAGGGSMQMMVMMALIFGIMYFMMIRPQQRKEKARREMINNLKSGTRVVFSGGIMGTVTNVKDGAFIIKIADGVMKKAKK